MRVEDARGGYNKFWFIVHREMKKNARALAVQAIADARVQVAKFLAQKRAEDCRRRNQKETIIYYEETREHQSRWYDDLFKSPLERAAHY